MSMEVTWEKPYYHDKPLATGNLLKEETIVEGDGLSGSIFDVQ